MRVALRCLVAGLAAALAGCSGTGDTQSEAPKSQEPAATPAVEELQFLDCPDDDGSCKASRAQLAGNWETAWKGDYQGQRNVAFTFSQGHNEPTFAVRRPIQGCAWRMVIMASGSAKVDESDRANYQLDCGRLDGRDREEAERVAELIARRISGAALGKMPALEAQGT